MPNLFCLKEKGLPNKAQLNIKLRNKEIVQILWNKTLDLIDAFWVCSNIVGKSCPTHKIGECIGKCMS